MSDAASCSDIRAKIREAFSELDARETVYHPSWVGRDGAGEEGIFWSCEVNRTAFVSARNVRSTTSISTEDGVPCVSSVTVRLLFRYQIDDMPASYDRFLNMEPFVLVCIANADWTGTSGPKIGEIDRQIIGDGTWHLVIIPMEVPHSYEGST